VSAAKSKQSADKEQRRARRRRRRQVAAATGSMLLVAAAVAGEPIGASGAVPFAGGAGGGLIGLTDPDSVSANGESGEDDRIGDEVLKSASNIDRLRQLNPGDLPSGPLGISGVMLEAYMNAAESLGTELPSCNLHWSLLASVGRIESNHARGGQVDGAGNTVPHILGPVLNGGGFAAIKDTDGGKLDDDARWDRAVGAMQFIPSTWRGYASDGNNDGVSSPHNVYDATVAAGKYLCSGGMDLSNPKDQATAVFRYNHSDSYVSTVLIWADAYKKGTSPLPSTAVPSPAELAAMGPPPAAGLPGAKPGKQPKPGSPGTTTTTKTTTVTPTKTTTTTTTSSTPCTPGPTTSTTTTTTTPTTTTPTSTTTTTTTTTTTPTSTTTTTTTPTCTT
jgi:hypothetical protein